MSEAALFPRKLDSQFWFFDFPSCVYAFRSVFLFIYSFPLFRNLQKFDNLSKIYSLPGAEGDEIRQTGPTKVLKILHIKGTLH